MCELCSYIFEYELLYCRTRKGSKRNLMQEIERKKFIEMGSPDVYLAKGFALNGISIVAETGDPFCKGSIDDVTYCPYCGRKLGDK